MTEIKAENHYFKADGIKFHYTIRGTGGPILVAQSVGWGPSAAYLWNLLQPLEKLFTVVYFEPRGNGLSGRPSDESQMSNIVMAHDLEHLREHLDLASFPVLFGHSNGGCIATAYAALYPNKVEKLLLMDPEINGDVPTDNFTRFATKRKDDPVYGTALQALVGAFGNPPQTDEAFVELMGKILPYYFNDTNKAAMLMESMEIDRVPPRSWAFLQQGKLDRENPFNHLAEAAKVKAKTLIVHGRDDALCGLQRARELHGRIDESHLVVLDCGHFPVIEKPEEFWAAVNRFLSMWKAGTQWPRDECSRPWRG